MSEYQIAEQFLSINGEGPRSGQLAYFIRFPGCNLNCSLCDTKWANRPGVPTEKWTDRQLAEAVRKSGAGLVTLTGGEPLLQKDLGLLLDTLAEETETLAEIETNGSIDIRPMAERVNRPYFTLDCKLPGSGMQGHMLPENYELLCPEDTVKFVCGSREDLDVARDVMNRYDLRERCHVYLSPVFGRIEPADIVEYMKEHRMNGVTLQLQIHKFIWDPDKKGV